MPQFTGIKNELSRLGVLRDSVYLEGLSEEEVCALEAEVGMLVPSLLREYYREVGLTQDLTNVGGDAVLQLHTTARGIDGSRWHLRNLFGDDATTAFPLGYDQANRVWAVMPSPFGEQLVEFDSETFDITPRQLFSDWFAEIILLAIDCSASLTPNTKKRRYVQFTFRTDNEERLFNALNEVTSFERFGDWEHRTTLSSGVTTSKLLCALAGQSVTMTLSAYENWMNPMLSFDFSEPVLTPKDESLLWRLNVKFRAADLGYSLVDYGPMPEHSSSD